MNPSAINKLFIKSPGASSFVMDLQMVVNTTHEHTSEITEHAVERGANITDHIRATPDRVQMQIYVSNCPVFDDRLTMQAQQIDWPTYTQDLKTTPIGLPKNPGPSFPSVGALASAVGSLVDSIFSSPPSYASTTWGPPKAASQGVAAMLYGFAVPFDGVQDALAKLEPLRVNGELLELYTPKRAYDNMVLSSIQMTRGREDGDGATLNLTFRSIRLVESKLTRAPAASVPLAKPVEDKGAQAAKEINLRSVAAALLKTVFGPGFSLRGPDLTK